jgi:endo-1,4-beta-xylanase
MIRPCVLLVALTGCPSDDPKDPPGTTTDPTDPTPTDPPFGGLARPVVLPSSPLSLDNPQGYEVSWPLWGGSITLHEEVQLHVSMQATGSASGLVLAGPGAPRDRSAVEVMSADGAWSLRETAGGELVQELALEQGATELQLVLAAGGGSVRAGELELTLQGSLTEEASGLYVYLEPGATLQLDDVSLSQPLPVDVSLGEPLRELAAAHGLSIGNATDIWPPMHDLHFDALMAQQFDRASPTEFYWPTTRGEDQDFFFLPADLMVNYALVHDQTLTGMFLVWDFSLPYWVEDLAYSEGPEALGVAYDEHITALVSRYRGQVDTWVVVNEAIWGPGDAGNNNARFAQTLWYDWLGEEHIERAFHTARAADPDAVLMYNETGAEELGDKSDFLYDMVEDFLARDVPIDAVGLQFHVHAGSPPDLASVQANLERFGDLGLDVYITELDVSLEGIDEPDELEQQAAIYRGILETCLAVPACRSYTVFGFSDRYAWDELGDATPLLFDEDYVPKPAYFEVQDALR